MSCHRSAAVACMLLSTSCTPVDGFADIQPTEGERTEVLGPTLGTPGLDLDAPPAIGLERMPYQWVQVAVGAKSCAVDSSNRLVCWGDDRETLRPEGGTRTLSQNANCIVPLAGGLHCSDGYDHFESPGYYDDVVYVQVVHGYAAVCGLREVDNKADCWWYSGLVGTGQEWPYDVEYVDISLGGYLGCGVTPDHELLCWGAQVDGERHLLEVPEGDYLEVEVTNGVLACGLRTDHTVVCWGDEWELPPASFQPPDVEFATIDATGWFACGIRLDDGGIECWGLDGHLDTFGDLPDGEFVALDITHLGGCAIDTAADLHCWAAKDPHGGFSPP